MRTLAALGASLAFALSLISLSHGFADLAAGSARAWMREWQQQRQLSSAEQWTDAVERLSLARRLNPLNADYSADLGRLTEWRSWLQTAPDETSRASRALAGELYRESLGKRPSWGFAWAHYAENQMLSGQPGPDLEKSLRRSIELAPWEPGVQLKVAFVGMAAWDSLSPELRDDVTDSVERAVQLDVHRDEIVRLAIQYDWLDNLIPLMRTERQIATLNFVVERSRRR